MNRIFHARIAWYQHLYLILLGGLAFFLLWDKNIILAGMCMVLLVFLIERFIHTTYTITTDGKLILSIGRFSKPKVIWIKDIASVYTKKSVKIMGISALSYVLIAHVSGRYTAVLPIKEREFVELLEEQRKHIEQEINK